MKKVWKESPKRMINQLHEVFFQNKKESAVRLCCWILSLDNNGTQQRGAHVSGGGAHRAIQRLNLHPPHTI